MKKTLAFLAVALATLAALSACRSPLGESSQTTAVTIAVGGVLPPARSLTDGPGSRVLVPTTVEARVTASWEGGTPFTQTVPVSGGQATIRRLPLGVAIMLYFEALDAAGNVLTVGSIPLEPLSTGSNPPQTVTLKPSASMTITELDVLNAGDPRATSVDEGAVNYYSFIAGIDGEYQVLFDTGKAQWAWLKLYDEQWKELPVICSDPEQGWAVVHLLELQQVYVAVSNTVSSPGYPAGSLTGSIVVSPALFTSSSGSGSGTSASPMAVGSEISAGVSIFAAAGTYSLTSTAVVNVSCRMYGGFKSGDWTKRDADSYPSRLVAGPDIASTVSVSVTSLLDGLTIVASPLSGSNMNTTGVAIQMSGSLVVNDCVIQGSPEYDPISSQSISSSAVSVGADNSATIEIASCELHAGGAYNQDTWPASTYGLMVSNGTVYVHDCDIDGGYARGNGGASSQGVWVAGANVVIAGSRIWGGIALSDNTEVHASAVGVFAEYGENMLAVANSVVSGGYAHNSRPFESGYLRGPEYLHGLETYTIPVNVCGSVIDSGFCVDPSTDLSNVSSTSTEETGIIRLEACIVTLSSVNSFGDLFHDAEAENATTCGGCLAVHSGDITYGSGTGVFPEPDELNTDMPAISPATFFQVFSNVYTGSYPADYTLWLANSYRARASYASSLTTSYMPYSDGTIAGYSVTSYPALLIDLAGNQRPTTGPWKRGAYE